MIKFECPSCGKRLGVKEEYAGRQVKCTQCGKPARVPDQVSPREGAAIAQPPSALTTFEQSPDAISLDQIGSLEPTDETLEPQVNELPANAPHNRDGQMACPRCGTQVSTLAVLCVNCGYNLKTGKTTRMELDQTSMGDLVKDKAAKAVTGGVNLLVLLLVGAVTALIGGGIWAVIVHVTGYEIGFVAWGLGLLVGMAVAATGQGEGMRVGLIAALMALVSLAAGKIMIIEFSLPSIVAGEITKHADAMNGAMFWSMSQDKSFSPQLNEAIAQHDSNDPFPDKIQEQIKQQIQQRLSAMNDAQKKNVAQRFAPVLLAQVPYWEKLVDSLSPFDILWCALALFTAYRVGGGFKRSGSTA